MWDFSTQPKRRHRIAGDAHSLPANNGIDIERNVTVFAAEPDGSLIVAPNAATVGNHDLIAELALRYRLPVVYSDRYFTESGGLISFGNNGLELFGRAASYIDRILKGAKPAALPVQRSLLMLWTAPSAARECNGCGCC